MSFRAPMPTTDVDGHEPTFESRRRARGAFLPGHRPRYGYAVICECGWSAITDGNKADARRMHRAHLRDVKGKT